MALRDRIVGRGLAGLLQTKLKGDGRPQIRVSGFQADEIAAALTWSGLDRPGDRDVILLVSGAQRPPLDEILSPEHFTVSGNTATWGRNNNTHGFVYIQMDQESDAQSTRAMYPLKDSSFFDDDAWTYLLDGLHPEGVRPPEVLTHALATFVRAYSVVRTLQLRPFADLLAEVAQGWAETEYAADLSPEVAAAIVDRGLPGMGLFRFERLAKSLVAKEDSAALRDVRALYYGSVLRRPSGAELDRDRILGTLQSLQLDDDPERHAKVSRAITAFVEGDDRKSLGEVDFGVFSQCLRPIRSQHLGTDIRDFLQARHGDLLPAFEEGDWESGLNERESAAALSFLQSPIFDQIPSTLQKRVLRLKPKRESYGDPLHGLLESLESLIDDDASISSFGLSLSEGADPDLLGLFAFLYVPALKELQAAIGEEVEVALDPRLLAPTPWGEEEPLEGAEESEDEGDDGEDEPSTGPQDELELTLSLGAVGSVTFLWHPGELGVLQLWTEEMGDLAYQRHAGAIPAHLLGDEAGALPTFRLDEGEPPPAGSWWAARARHLEILSKDGLTSDGIKAYLKGWGEALNGLLRGGERAEDALLTFLGSDCLRILEPDSAEGHRAWMLGSHPLRLRWFARWRALMVKHCVGLIRGDLQLSERNPEFGREQMKQWSPHRYPPVLSLSRGSVLLPVEERGWCETYLAFDQDHHTSNELDAASVKALVDVAASYVEERPWKRAGLHVLLLLGEGGSMSREFVGQLSRRSPDTHLILHVLAPEGSVDIDSLLESGSVTSLMSPAERSHFPLLEVRHHPWRAGDDLPKAIQSEQQIDLAIVPFLFSTQRKPKGRHESEDLGHLEADPVLLRPQTPNHDGRTELNIELRPPNPDRYLNAWGDAVARSHNHGPSTQDDQGYDYLLMLYDIQKTAGLYQTLRSLARQVTVIDIGLTRRQLMQIKHAPKLVQLTSGVGKNGDYCLVTASDKVQESLRARVADLMGNLDEAEGAPPGSDVNQVVDQVSKLSPGLAFVAGDRGIHTAELLGRQGIRRWVEQLPGGPQGKVFWVDLDDHGAWFPSRHPDLARVSLTGSGEGVEIAVLLCESKFSDDGGAAGAAAGELRAGRALFEDVFGKGGLDHSDHRLWCVALARALGDAWSPQGDELSKAERSALMDGRILLTSVTGFGIVWRQLDDALPPLQEAGIEVITATTKMLRQTLKKRPS